MELTYEKFKELELIVLRSFYSYNILGMDNKCTRVISGYLVPYTRWCIQYISYQAVTFGKAAPNTRTALLFVIYFRTRL